ncbi:hypothetical protein IL306_012116 [Fusarium sp. DS 682]|nr:hypothetical protein IL306_012116 [Fusarium sp. DS 682]
MSRNRPSAQRRRNMRRSREKLRQVMANREKGQAEAAACQTGSAQASTTEATTNTLASDAKDNPDESKARPCKHRHLPDRHYYHREEKFEHRFLALQRRIDERFDDNIAKGRAAIDADYDRHVSRMRHNKKMQALQTGEVERKYQKSADRANKEIARLKRDVEDMREQNGDLRDELSRERRRYRQLLAEQNEAAWEKLEAEFPL